jgi:hypothetical protein
MTLFGGAKGEACGAFDATSALFVAHDVNIKALPIIAAEIIRRFITFSFI